ncbi:Gldg family protein, partial [Candidatus Sumerlaeota bacterium]|nr:Gldg family protein [Candidatus Sumerlaeota bacterium]
MRGLLGAASLVLALIGLLAAASWEMEIALILLALAGVCLLPVWLRGPRRLDLGALLHMVLVCVFFIGSLVCIHLLIAHRGIEWDLTSNRRNSFSPLTVQQLRALPGDVEITAVVTDASEMRPLLERLSALTPRVSFRLLHFIRDWHEVISLAEEWGITEPGPGTVLFSCQVNERTVRQTVLRAGDGPEFEFDEQAWVNACIEVTRERSPQVFFTLNHGERDLGAELRGAREIFASLGFEVRFGTLRDLPSDVDLIAIAGPQRDFDEPDLALLEDALQAGVGVLLLLDPPHVIGSERYRTPIPLTRLEAWVEANGVDLPEGVIAEDDPEMAT